MDLDFVHTGIFVILKLSDVNVKIKINQGHEV